MMQTAGAEIQDMTASREVSLACSGGAIGGQLAGAIGWSVLAGASFFAANQWSHAGWLSLLYLLALLRLAEGAKWRLAFYPGVAAGMVAACTRLDFFWTIFSAGAVALWLVYAVWIGIFVALARLCLKLLPRGAAFLLIPFIWTGIEYFRSELYFLRFAWLSPGFAFGQTPWAVPASTLGAYGIGFILMAMACAASWTWGLSKSGAGVVLMLGGGLVWAANLFGGKAIPPSAPVRQVFVAGMQMEFPAEKQVIVGLREMVRKYPQAELLVLSEYTLEGPVPEAIKEWCRKNGKYLVIGGKDPAERNQFYNTAFVVDPEGRIVFKQTKSVPIQFFKDGLPAPGQEVWQSPWGKIGICICYDLSYRRVTDRLIKKGAQALIVPTMDVADWGERQHWLHARVAPMRAAEYGIPIFRLASSGISQGVDKRGRGVAAAPFPGDGAMLSMRMTLAGPGRRPLDAWLGPFAFGICFLTAAFFVLRCVRNVSRRQHSRHSMTLARITTPRAQ